jgi:hypothetical protein
MLQKEQNPKAYLAKQEFCNIFVPAFGAIAVKEE